MISIELQEGRPILTQGNDPEVAVSCPENIKAKAVVCAVLFWLLPAFDAMAANTLDTSFSVACEQLIYRSSSGPDPFHSPHFSMVNSLSNRLGRPLAVMGSLVGTPICVARCALSRSKVLGRSRG